MKKLLPVLALAFGYFAASAQPSFKLSVKTYRTDLAFTCITVDSANDVWAGTSGKGLVKISNDVVTPIVLTSGNFDKVIIRGLAADGVNGIWVAHEGYNANIATGGGVDFINRINPSNKQHYNSISLVNSNSNKGLPSRRTASIGIDKNGKVWTSHTYHDLTVPGGNPSYLVYPGGVGVKTPAMPVFDSVGPINPYPAYTVNTPITQSPGTRVCPTLGIGNTQNEVWVSVASYNAFPFQNSRICKWSLAGTYLGEINETNSLLALGAANGNPRVMAIHFDNKNRVWVGLNQGKGIGVKMDTGWAYAGKPNIMPVGAVVNQNAIASNSKGEVFIGTTAGLLKYKGTGPFNADASYVFYTTANGLPNNNVTGVVTDKTGAIWICTAAGMAKMRDGDLMVYNLKSVPAFPVITGNDADDAMRIAIASYDSQMPQDVIDKDLLYIAADSSESTIFKYTGSNPNNIKFRIREDQNSQNALEFGSFTIKYRSAANDSLRVAYRHPSFLPATYTSSPVFNGRVITLDLVDTTVSPAVIVLSKKIKFLLPPVLLVHGIWSSAEDSWNISMVPFLRSNGSYHYDPQFMYAVSYPNDRHFSENTLRIPNYIEDLMNKCRAGVFSTGKVDVLCHSMGGILTRLYLENKSSYKNNIHKLVTLNTPHSGSPLANIVTASTEITKYALKVIGKKDPTKGALEDLAIGMAPIENFLNNPQRNIANGVPAAAIYTTDSVGALIEVANQLISVRSFIRLSKFYKKNVFTGTLGAIHFAILCLKLDLLKTTPCSDNTPLNECMSRIYNGPSDWIVSTTSQKGGLDPQATYYFSETNHLNVHKMQPVQNKVLELLRANPSSTSFSKTGFKPASLQWVPGVGTVGGRLGQISSETVSVVSPAAGTNYLPNDSVEIKIRASAGVSKALIYIDHSGGYSAFAIYQPDSVFGFRIPVDAGGRMDYKIFAFDTANNIISDSSYINVQLPAGVVLDSIRIERTDDRIVIEKDDSTDFVLWGYYGGQQRFISNMPGINYTFETGGIATPGNAYTLKGLATGFDYLKVMYGGKTDSTYIEVVPKTIGSGLDPLPVKLSMFSGRFNNNSVLLKWVTAQEQNNGYFTIELSYDGVHFTNIGRVDGKGNSNTPSSYDFTDAIHFKSGRNFYRLRQIDIDGKFTYSSIVTIIISASGEMLVTIYPNPAKDYINIAIPKYDGKNYTLQLLNIAGVKLLSSMLNGGQQRVPLPKPIAPGLYVIRLLDADGKELASNKLIIQ
jgi:pimeloyl-ACP methyl ester carboxylesterase